MSETGAGFWDEAEVISCYTRSQAIDDGVLVDLTEWASAEKGFLGGFRCPVVMTRALWEVVDIDSRAVTLRSHQSTRGRAHDVLWMASLACRRALARDRTEPPDELFSVLLTNGRRRKATLRVVGDGEGITIGYPEDF